MTEPAISLLPPTTNTATDPQTGDTESAAMLLVTEFPPPPFYYSHSHSLSPPEIPYRAFRVAAKKVRQARRQNEGLTEEEELQQDDDSIDVNDPKEPLVAVFGEIVEDPTLNVLLDETNNQEEWEDPTIIKENVKILNRQVLQGFLELVKELARDPTENKKLRDELSHNIFLMLQECNKFRDHQAREILISTLEMQLERRREMLDLLNNQIKKAEDVIEKLRRSKEKSADNEMIR